MPPDAGPTADSSAPTPPPIPGNVAQAMRDDAQALFEDARSAILDKVPTWLESAAFYKGMQWGYSTHLGFHLDPDTPEEELQVVNMIESFVRTMIADVLRHIPNPEVVAGADDPDQVARAEAAHRLVRMFVSRNIVDFAELEKLCLGAQVFGEGYLYGYWDPKAGKATSEYIWQLDPATGTWSPVYDEMGAHRVRRKYEGELATRYSDVFHLFPDPSATSWKEVGYVVEEVEVSKRRAGEMFPSDYLGNPVTWAESSSFLDEVSLRSIEQGVPGTFAAGMRAESNRQIKIKRLFEKPTDRFPQGRFVCWSEGVILAMGPLEVWPWHYLPGQARGFGYHPTGVVQPLIPQQRLLNKSQTVTASHVDTMVPGMFVPRNANFQIDSMTNVPGWVGYYNAGFRPEPYSPPQIPGQMFEWANGLVATMKTTSTISDVSRGEMPQGAESGRALAYLHEFEQGVRGPEVQHFRLMLVALFQTLLRLAERHYRDGRMLVLLGEDNAWTQEPFHREGVDFDVDLIIEPMSGAPTSKALRQDEILRATQFGILTPPEAKVLLEYDTADRNSYDPKAAERSAARGENMAWRQNPYTPPIEAVAGEDHAVHLEEHLKQRRGVFYKSLPPEGRHALDMHYEHHVWFQLSQMQGMGMQVPMVDGGGAGAPPAGPQQPNGMGGSGDPNAPIPSSAPVPAPQQG
jgi:hypothetical protein